jgi:N6-adenosine-specific RNA methylase IME4
LSIDINEISNNVKEHNEARDDYQEFQQMIDHAEKDPKTITETPTTDEKSVKIENEMPENASFTADDRMDMNAELNQNENEKQDQENHQNSQLEKTDDDQDMENTNTHQHDENETIKIESERILQETMIEVESTTSSTETPIATSIAITEVKFSQKLDTPSQKSGDAMDEDDIDEELWAGVMKAKEPQKEEDPIGPVAPVPEDTTSPPPGSLVKRKRGRPKKGTGPRDSLPPPPEPFPRSTRKPPVSRYADEAFQIINEPVNRVSSDFAAIQAFDEEETLLREARIAEGSEQEGIVELRCLADYRSIIDRKQKQKEKEEKKRTPKKKKKVEETETKALHELADEYVKKSLGDPQSTYQLHKYQDGTYINCDLRYFNLSSLGKFDIVLIDPPWRIGGGQRHGDQAAVFSNCNFKLQYNTMSNEEIMDLDVESLSDQGFCFLWVLNSTLQFGLDLLNKWGYTFVEKIVWVKKSRHHDTMVNVTHGYYLLHSTELVLIGMKSFSMNKKKGLGGIGPAPPKENEMTQRLQYISKVSNDVIFARVKRQSQKPEQLYQVIESMMPGSRKVELFARNNNIREGWLSLGNRLGPTFDSFDQDWQWTYSCNECETDLSPIPFQKMNSERAYVRKDSKAPARSHKRFKSKSNAGIDLCESCVTNEEKHGPTDQYFVIENLCEEPIYHDWYNCDNCGQRPICGVRFSCTECEDYDLCETCFDQIVMQDKEHKHDAGRFDAIELPDPGMGFPVHHRIRCSSCLTCPIIGERFHCLECRDVNMCRNCFFKQKDIKGHEDTHTTSLIPEHASGHRLKCSNCKRQKEGVTYKCKTCSNFIMCEDCFEHHDELMPFEKYPTHKQFHRFFKLRAE